MGFRNTRTSFGWPTRALHWITAVIILSTIPLGAWIARAEITLDTIWLFGLHKTLGTAIFALVLLRIGWHYISPPPPPLQSAGQSELTLMLARVTHRLFYVVLVAMPIAGWVGSSATGIDSVVFGRWTLPRISPVSEAWENSAFAIHGALGFLLVALILLHIAGAVYRTLVVRDGTLSRMLRD